jgi:RNA polymerase sigma factor (sigma-70 family)
MDHHLMSASGSTTVSGAGSFQATRWSIVLAAAQPDSPVARKAVAALCEAYWYPVYAFIRRQGCDREKAKDLTQDLFANLIEKRSFQTLDCDKGRFRSFLLACVRHLLNHERSREKAVKRGGGYQIQSLDERLAEERYELEPVDGMSPDKLFDRRWALTLLEGTLKQLKREHEEMGRGQQFEALQGLLTDSGETGDSYREVARQLNVSANAARQAAHRLRVRFREVLRAQIAQTVAGPHELEAELRDLRALLVS